ncbi:MAG TPA: MGMT family protein [bacterium]|nr:MGMT family protein [bacterium]
MSDLRRTVYAVLRRVPHGRVVTYGQLALIAGRPRAGREVGWIASEGGTGLPWQRVVNRFGGLASGYGPSGRTAHKRDLNAEGIRVRRNLTVDLRRYQWWPDDALCRRLGVSLETRATLSVARHRPPPKPPVERRPSKRRDAAIREARSVELGRAGAGPAPSRGVLPGRTAKRRFLPDYPPD